MTESLAHDTLAAAKILSVPGARVVAVQGDDAEPWLDSLVTTGVARMQPGEARRSFLLTPTGRIRAEFWVARIDDGFRLVQPAGQPDPVDTLLGRYRLSSDVGLEETGDAVVIAMDEALGDLAPRWSARLTAGSGVWAFMEHSVAGVATPVDAPSYEELLLARGIASFPRDLGPESLPLEAPTHDAIDHEKGCYLGQEAVAKTHNRGRPPFSIVSLACEVPVAAGTTVEADGREVGVVTTGGAQRVLARVKTSAVQRQEDLTAGGSPLARIDR